MQKIFYTLLFWTLSLCACSTNLPTTDATPLNPATLPPIVITLTPETFSASPTTLIPEIIETLQSPPTDQPASVNEVTITPNNESCGYQWAYKDMPEINQTFDAAIKTLNPDTKGWVTAFGEDCVYADGHADFSAMETDFYIHLNVADLSDFESFGNWIAQAMTAIEDLPDNLIAGPKPGFVEFWFIKNDAEHVIVRVPIQKYKDETVGKSGEELFKLFYTNP